MNTIFPARRDATTVAVPPAVVGPDTIRASGAASTAAIAWLRARSVFRLLFVPMVITASATTAASATAAMPVAIFGIVQNVREVPLLAALLPGAARRQRGVAVTGGSCRVTVVAASTRSFSPGGGSAAAARPRAAAVAAKPRTSFWQAWQRRRCRSNRSRSASSSASSAYAPARACRSRRLSLISSPPGTRAAGSARRGSAS